MDERAAFEAWFNNPDHADPDKVYILPIEAESEVRRLVKDVALRAWEYRASLAAQPAAAESYAERIADDLADAIFAHFQTPAGSEGDESAWDHALAVIKAAQPAASAEPSDEDAAKFADQHGMYYDQDASIAGAHARALLARYGRPAGDAQPVAVVKENPYCPDGLSDEINEYLPNGTVLYAAPVATQKADDTRDAGRWREVERQATKKTAYDRYGNGAYWSVGVFSDDSRQTFGETIDAAIAQQRKGE